MTVRKIKSIGDVPYPIDVGTDALSPLLTAGAALGITGDGPTDSAAWLQRTSTGDGPTTAKCIHGNTVRWNQLVSVPMSEGETQLGITFTPNADGTVALSGTSTQTIYKNLGSKSVAGHTYLVRKGGTLATDANLALYNDGGGITVNSQGSAIATANAEKNFFFRVANGAMVDGTVLPQIFDLTAMFGAGSEPATVAEFEALYPLPYYPYDAGSLLPVNMAGIETVGFNLFDASTAQAGKAWKGDDTPGQQNACYCSALIPVFPNTDYYTNANGTGVTYTVRLFDADGHYIRAYGNMTSAGVFNTGEARYVGINSKTAVVPPDALVVNLSDPTRNGEYEPYWHQTRTIPAGTLRGAGSVFDELTETGRITRIGEVDLGTLTWRPYVTGSTGKYRMVSSGIKSLIRPAASSSSLGSMTCARYATITGAQAYQLVTGISVATDGDIVAYDPDYAASDSAAAFTESLSGVMLHYDLATPTTVEIDPPLNLTYRTAAGGTERVIVPTGENSAPPTIVAAQGYTAESLRDAALATIAPVENGLASTNYAVGSYLVHGGQLCRVTTAIATGEAITIGTNVTATTVMAEILSLVQ